MKKFVTTNKSGIKKCRCECKEKKKYDDNSFFNPLNCSCEMKKMAALIVEKELNNNNKNNKLEKIIELHKIKQ